MGFVSLNYLIYRHPSPFCCCRFLFAFSPAGDLASAVSVLDLR